MIIPLLVMADTVCYVQEHADKSIADCNRQRGINENNFFEFDQLDSSSKKYYGCAHYDIHR